MADSDRAARWRRRRLRWGIACYVLVVLLILFAAVVAVNLGDGTESFAHDYFVAFVVLGLVMLGVPAVLTGVMALRKPPDTRKPPRSLPGKQKPTGSVANKRKPPGRAPVVDLPAELRRLGRRALWSAVLGVACLLLVAGGIAGNIRASAEARQLLDSGTRVPGTILSVRPPEPRAPGRSGCVTCSTGCSALPRSRSAPTGLTPPDNRSL